MRIIFGTLPFACSVRLSVKFGTRAGNSPKNKGIHHLSPSMCVKSLIHPPGAFGGDLRS